MTSTAPARLTHQPALDGIRAVAVLVVMLYHSGPTWFGAGFLGVDVFLVLSGFLITLLLVQEIERSGTVDRRAFWGRRARRLLPALFAVLLAVAVYAAFAATAGERDGIRGDGIASLLYVQNWRLIFTEQSYFAQVGTPSPLRHMWSLAIEEQWYLVWPLVFLGLYRLSRGRLARVAGATAALAAGAAVLMLVLHDPDRDPSRIYYGTDTRAQALLVGALLAFLFARWDPRAAGRHRRAARVGLDLLGLAGAGYLAWAMLTMDDGTRSLYEGGFSLVAIAAAAVVAAAMVPGVVRAVLRLPPLPAIGLISYGLYLWHWPIFVFLSAERTGLHDRPLLLVRLTATFAVAIASYLLLERPIREQRWAWVRAPRRWVPISAVVVVGATLLATAPIVPARSEEAAGGLTDAEVARFERGARGFVNPPDDKTRVLVAGDSVAFTLAFWGLSDAQSDTVWLGTSAILGCGIARGVLVSNGVRRPQPAACARWPEHYAAQVASHDPDVAVLLVGAWDVYDRVVDGRTVAFGSARMERLLRHDLDDARRVLTRDGAHLLLLTTPCYPTESQELGIWGEKERTEPWRVDWLNRALDRYAADHASEVTVADLHREVCPGARYARTIDGTEVRSDGLHFAKDGTRRVWDWLAPIARRTAAAYPRERRITGGTTSTTAPAPTPAPTPAP